MPRRANTRLPHEGGLRNQTLVPFNVQLTENLTHQYALVEANHDGYSPLPTNS